MTAEPEYRFDRFRLVPGQQMLLRDGEPVPLGARAFDMLRLLLERQGQMVSKSAMFDAVWPNLAVEESNLTVTMSTLRKALGCGVEGKRFVATVPGRGYRFVMPVERVAPGERAAPPPAAAVPPEAQTRTNLTRMLTRLVGRVSEVERLAGLLGESRLVTVTGVGGVGKTRVAAAVGEAVQRRYADGVWWVELAALAAPELVAETIVSALGIGSQGDRAAAGLLAAYLQRKELLLILDNCEHLIDEVARIAEFVLRGCPGVSVLATSREPLRIAGEHVYPLPPLGYPERAEGISAAEALGHSAVRLFVERAGLAVPDFALTDATAPAVAETCRRLDGLALAIELAAPRLKLVAPGELLDRLADRFRLLTGGSRTALPRQQTLKAVIDWSYNLLSEPERVLLRRLAVFGGGFTVESATAVATDPPAGESEVLELLGGLVDKSLVVPVAAGSAGIRYRLLESTRAYGLERLAEAGEQPRRRRLADFLIALLEGADARYPTTDTATWLAEAEPELDNLRAGLEWAFGPDGDAERGLHLVSRAVPLWEELSLMAERQRWVRLAAERLDPHTPPETRARILMALAYTGSYGQRRMLDGLLEAAALLAPLDRPLLLGEALCMAGAALVAPGDSGPAEPYLRDAERLLRPLGPTKMLSTLLAAMGVARAAAGDTAAARALSEESLAIARATGFRSGQERLASILAEYDFAEGQVEAAIARARAGAAQSRASGNLRLLASLSNNLAGYLLAAEDRGQGEAAAREALKLSRALGDRFGTTIALEHLALAAALGGDPARAARLAGYGEGYYRAAAQARDTTEAATWRALQAKLAAALAPGDLARLMAEGARLTEEEAAAAA